MNQDSLCAYGRVEEKMNQYGDMILRLAFTYMKNRQDAEDILQDVLVKYMEFQKEFENLEHEKAWFLRVTINHAKNKLRSSWFQKRVEWKQEHGFVLLPEENYVLEAVMSMEAKYREVIYLYYFEEYKTSEIADILGKKESTIRSILKRGREKLKYVLKEGYDYA